MTSLQLATPPPVRASTDTVFSRVLLGVDFSPASLAAARWATAHVAPRSNALLSHVLPFPEQSGEDDDGDRERAQSLRQLKPALFGGLGGFAATPQWLKVVIHKTSHSAMKQLYQCTKCNQPDDHR